MIQKSLTPVRLSSTDITIKPLSRHTVQFATTVTPPARCTCFQSTCEAWWTKVPISPMRHSIGLLEPMFCKPFLSASDAYYFIDLTSPLSFFKLAKTQRSASEIRKIVAFYGLWAVLRENHRLGAWLFFLPSSQIITINVRLGFANFGRWRPIKKTNTSTTDIYITYMHCSGGFLYNPLHEVYTSLLMPYPRQMV